MSLPFPLALPELDLLVGHVDERSARVWTRIEGGARGVLRVRGARGAPSTATREYEVSPDPEADFTSVVTVDGLESDRGYDLELSRGGETIAGAFRTMPGARCERVCFAFVSCHLPFAAARSGAIVVDESAAMLDAFVDAIAARDVRLVLHLGDQVYADPERLPALDLWRRVREARRRGEAVDPLALYRELHRGYFALPAMRAVHARTANVMMWDDGEIRDVWGSVAPEGEDAALAGAMFGAARRAFFEWQRAHGPPRVCDDVFASAFDVGPASVFVLDLRSVRDASRRMLLGEAQWRAFERWLVATDDRPVRFVASSVPLLHTPESLTEKLTRAPLSAVTPNAFFDRWSADAFHHELERMLALLHGRRVVVLAGDIHIGAAMELWDPSRTRAIPQWISSAVTHRPTLVHRLESEAVSRLATIAGSRFPIDASFHELGNNFGIVEVVREGDDVRTTFELWARAGRAIAPVHEVEARFGRG